MSNVKREIENLVVTVIFLLILLTAPSAISGGEKTDNGSKEESENKIDLTLTIKDNLISLRAKDASLKNILEEIGREMKIEVVASIPEEEKVTIDFDKLSITEALKKLSTNYGYVMDSENEEKNITKIIVLPKGRKTVASGPSAKKPGTQKKEKKETKRPAPFKFEFDPSKYIKEEK